MWIAFPSRFDDLFFPESPLESKLKFPFSRRLGQFEGSRTVIPKRRIPSGQKSIPSANLYLRGRQLSQLVNHNRETCRLGKSDGRASPRGSPLAHRRPRRERAARTGHDLGDVSRAYGRCEVRAFAAPRRVPGGCVVDGRPPPPANATHFLADTSRTRRSKTWPRAFVARPSRSADSLSSRLSRRASAQGLSRSLDVRPRRVHARAFARPVDARRCRQRPSRPLRRRGTA